MIGEPQLELTGVTQYDKGQSRQFEGLNLDTSQADCDFDNNDHSEVAPKKPVFEAELPLIESNPKK